MLLDQSIQLSNISRLGKIGAVCIAKPAGSSHNTFLRGGKGREARQVRSGLLLYNIGNCQQRNVLELAIMRIRLGFRRRRELDLADNSSKKEQAGLPLDSRQPGRRIVVF
jgi:hypothetical protein